MTVDKRRNTGVRLATVGAVLVALLGITPAVAVAPSVSPFDDGRDALVASISSSPVDDPSYWSSMMSVEDFLAEQEQKRVPKTRKIKKSTRTTTSESIPDYAGDGERWSKSQVRAQLEVACDKYEITGADRAWIIEAGLTIMWRESHYHIHSMNKSSSAAGICQFLAAWGDIEYRLDPVWSINRFVKVFADGGKGKIRQHWAATI